MGGHLDVYVCSKKVAAVVVVVWIGVSWLERLANSLRQDSLAIGI